MFNGKPYPIASTDYVLNLGNQCVSAFTGMDLNVPGGDLWIVGMYNSQINFCIICL
jgi:saccharopepsin